MARWIRSAAAAQPGSNSGSWRSVSLGSRKARAACGSVMPRQTSNWATTAGIPAARCSVAIGPGSWGWIRQRLTIKPAVWLLLLFGVPRVFAEPRAILLQSQLLAARLAPQRVVVVARLFTDKKDGFGLLLPFAFRHRR